MFALIWVGGSIILVVLTVSLDIVKAFSILPWRANKAAFDYHGVRGRTVKPVDRFVGFSSALY